MAEHNGLDGDDTGFVPLFAGFLQLCAGAVAGLGSALGLNVVGPFTGLVAAWGVLVLANALAVAVVAALAMLVTAAGTLLAADWRADATSRQAWAEIDVAAAELNLTIGTAAPSQIDPRYPAATTNEPLQSVLRAHRFASSAPVVDAGAEARCVTRMVAASGESIPASLAADAGSRIRRKISMPPASDIAMAHSPCRKAASTSLGQEPLVVVSCPARPQVVRAELAVSAVRIAANGEVSPEWLPRDRYVQARALPHGQIADIVVLSGKWGDRNACERSPGPSTGDGTVESGEPPSCRGPPSAAGHRSRPLETAPVERSAKDACELPAAAAVQPADPIVRDNLGHQVPVRAAELDVIETYLDQVLRDLLASPTPRSQQEDV